MKCGFCNFTDGCCYGDNPPKVRCTISGEFYPYGQDCFATVVVEPMDEATTPCLICGEGVSDANGPAICEACRDAVMRVRRDMVREMSDW